MLNSRIYFPSARISLVNVRKIPYADNRHLRLLIFVSVSVVLSRGAIPMLTKKYFILLNYVLGFRIGRMVLALIQEQSEVIQAIFRRDKAALEQLLGMVTPAFSMVGNSYSLCREPDLAF
jgi:hypothetical protein